MSDTPRDKLNEAAPHVERMKADLPPLPPTVYLVCEVAIEYNDEYYSSAGDGDGYTVVGVFASWADAQALAATRILNVGDEVPEWVVSTPADYPDWHQLPGGAGWEWHLGYVKEFSVQ